MAESKVEMELQTLGEKVSAADSLDGINFSIGENQVCEHAGSDSVEDISTQTCSLITFLCRVGCTLPPSGFLARVFTRGFIVLLAWAVLWSVIGQDVLPGGNIFGIFMVIVFSAFGGFLVSCIPCITIPPLLGMLVAGFMLNNVPGIDVARSIDKKWSSSLRSMALVVILLRSGLGLNTEALKKLKFTCVRLAFAPCVAEAVTAAIIVHFILGMKWLWAFQLG